MGVVSLLTVPFQIVMENTEQLAEKAAQAKNLGRLASAKLARTVSGKLCHNMGCFEETMWAYLHFVAIANLVEIADLQNRRVRLFLTAKRQPTNRDPSHGSPE